MKLLNPEISESQARGRGHVSAPTLWKVRSQVVFLFPSQCLCPRPPRPSFSVVHGVQVRFLPEKGLSVGSPAGHSGVWTFWCRIGGLETFGGGWQVVPSLLRRCGKMARGTQPGGGRRTLVSPQWRLHVRCGVLLGDCGLRTNPSLAVREPRVAFSLAPGCWGATVPAGFRGGFKGSRCCVSVLL